jgi:uncharacterized protein (DUF983 family)
MKSVRRALLLKCPHCGGGRMFFRWVRSFERCSKCGFRFDRGEVDYYIGAYTVNLIIAELIVVAMLLAAILYWWPDVPWEKLPYALVVPVILAPIVTYPYSKALWLGIDLMFRPADAEDFRSSSASGARP